MRKFRPSAPTVAGTPGRATDSVYRLSQKTGAVLFLLISGLALATEPAADPAPAAPAAEPAPAAPVEPTLPVLRYQAPAVYPPDALAAGTSASVLMVLDIDAEGTVVAASVSEPAGQGFDEAAVEAARSFRFDPARDATGTPTPARVFYRYRFTAAKAAPLSLEGRVVDASSDLPFPGLDARLTRDGSSPRLLRTDDDGRFRLSGVEAGEWTLYVTAPGHLAEAVPVTVKDGTVAQVNVRLRAEKLEEQITPNAVVVVEGKRAAASITERTLTQEEVRFLPGTGGDVVKVVQNLPGVARAPLGVGQLIIRGTAPEDSLYFLDGAGVPLVFHFSGLSTILNGDFVSEVAYLPGNYSARYGRALGGLVDLRTKDTLPEKSRGYIALDLFQGTAYVEQKVGDDTALEFSLRRSWIDAVLTPILSGSGASIRAPRYWDAQARVFHRLKSGGEVDALFVFSDDRFSVVGEEDDRVAIGLSTTFGKLRGRWKQPLADGWESELVVSGGPNDQTFAFDGDPDAAYERAWEFTLREELVRDYDDTHPIGWRLGVDASAGRKSFLYNVVAFSPYEEDAAWTLAPAVYVEPTFRLYPFFLTPSLRVDGLTYNFGYTRATADPRLAGRVVVTPTTQIKASVGRFSQFPTVRQLAPGGDGNPDLHEAWSLQSSLGVTQALPLNLSLEVTAFYNLLNDLVVGREDRFRFFTGPPPVGPFDTEGYANEGSGRVCGTELLLRLDAKKTLGLLSATFSNSERTGRDGETQLFTYDQPYVVNALASQELPKGWRVGARFRISAGDPYTPVVNRVYDMASRSFLPVYGDAGSARLPPVYSLDVRIDKEWAFRKWTLTTYLDVQNATNAQNPEVMSWTYDYSEEDPIAGLPIIPAIGVRGEW